MYSVAGSTRRRTCRSVLIPRRPGGRQSAQTAERRGPSHTFPASSISSGRLPPRSAALCRPSTAAGRHSCRVSGRPAGAEALDGCSSTPQFVGAKSRLRERLTRWDQPGARWRSFWCWAPALPPLPATMGPSGFLHACVRVCVRCALLVRTRDATVRVSPH
jgi:hypothetical protein